MNTAVSMNTLAVDRAERAARYAVKRSANREITLTSLDRAIARLCPGVQLNDADKQSLRRHIDDIGWNGDGYDNWTPTPVGTYPNLTRLLERLHPERYGSKRWPPEWAGYDYELDLDELSHEVGWPTGKFAWKWDSFRRGDLYVTQYVPGEPDVPPRAPSASELEQWVIAHGGADYVADHHDAHWELWQLKQRAGRPTADAPANEDAIVEQAIVEAEAGRPINPRDRLSLRQLERFRKAAGQSNLSLRDIRDALKDASGIGGPLVRISGDSRHTAGYFARENGDELSRKLKKGEILAA